MKHYTDKGAQLSDCGLYRYSLSRCWGEDGDDSPIVFLGLNPSTADADKDDATIRRVVGFAESHGHEAVIMLNLFAFRSTNPQLLVSAVDPIGPRNDSFLREWSRYKIVAAWGSHRSRLIAERAAAVLALLPKPIYCLGTTADGGPRHPLYVRGSQKLVVYKCKTF